MISKHPRGLLPGHSRYKVVPLCHASTLSQSERIVKLPRDITSTSYISKYNPQRLYQITAITQKLLQNLARNCRFPSCPKSFSKFGVKIWCEERCLIKIKCCGFPYNSLRIVVRLGMTTRSQLCKVARLFHRV